MRLILFWMVAVFALLAALLAAGHRRPLGSLKALMVMLFFNSLELFILGAPLLGLELLVVALAGGAAVWGGLAGRRLEMLGAPGRPRYTLARLAGLAVVLVLVHRLICQLAGPVPATPVAEPAAGGQAVLGGLVAGVLLASCALLIVAAFRYRPAEEGTHER